MQALMQQQAVQKRVNKSFESFERIKSIFKRSYNFEKDDDSFKKSKILKPED
jgi:hypothetical protein